MKNAQGKEDRLEQAIADTVAKYGDTMLDKDVCQLAKVTPATTQRWRRDGIGPSAARLGERLLRYDTVEVARWVFGGSE